MDPNVSRNPATPQSGTPSLAAIVAAVRLLSMRELADRVGCAKPTIYRMMARGQFPQPVLRCGTRFTRWSSTDVDAWLADPQGWIDTNSARAAATEAA